MRAKRRVVLVAIAAARALAVRARLFSNSWSFSKVLSDLAESVLSLPEDLEGLCKCNLLLLSLLSLELVVTPPPALEQGSESESE